jgi:hypothetical protein
VVKSSGCWLSVLALAVCGLVWAPPIHGDGLKDALARGDRAYASRGEINDGRGRADPTRIVTAIAAYEEALAMDPTNLEVRWKTMASLYFAGDFAASSEEVAHGFYERGRALGEAGVTQVRERLKLGEKLSEMGADEIRAAVPSELTNDVGQLYFWAAIDWGAWARTEGFLKIVTQGVAGKLRGYAKVSLALDPGIYRGGSQRLLAHMHANLPRVPFVSGWVDREKAVRFADQAIAVKADDVGNRVILGLVLLDTVPDRRSEGLAILEKVVATQPRAELVVEDQATVEMARKRLDEARLR